MHAIFDFFSDIPPHQLSSSLAPMRRAAPLGKHCPKHCYIEEEKKYENNKWKLIRYFKELVPWDVKLKMGVYIYFWCVCVEKQTQKESGATDLNSELLNIVVISNTIEHSLLRSIWVSSLNNSVTNFDPQTAYIERQTPRWEARQSGLQKNKAKPTVWVSGRYIIWEGPERLRRRITK